jgi:hypothetical protein
MVILNVAFCKPFQEVLHWELMFVLRLWLTGECQLGSLLVGLWRSKRIWNFTFSNMVKNFPNHCFFFSNCDCLHSGYSRSSIGSLTPVASDLIRWLPDSQKKTNDGGCLFSEHEEFCHLTYIYIINIFHIFDIEKQVLACLHWQDLPSGWFDVRTCSLIQAPWML